MKREDVPDEMVHAFVDGAIGSPPEVQANSPEWVRNGLVRALAAYEAVRLPADERQVRERVAAEIEQSLIDEPPVSVGVRNGLRLAVEIARGGQVATGKVLVSADDLAELLDYVIGGSEVRVVHEATLGRAFAALKATQRGQS